jgi:hypothetical protein
MDESSTTVPNPAQGTVSFVEFATQTNTRFNRNENLIYAVLVIVAITLVSIGVGTVGVVLDQMHFNNELYRDGQYVHTQTVVKTIYEKPTTEKYVLPDNSNN